MKTIKLIAKGIAAVAAILAITFTVAFFALAIYSGWETEKMHARFNEAGYRFTETCPRADINIHQRNFQSCYRQKFDAREIARILNLPEGSKGLTPTYSPHQNSIRLLSFEVKSGKVHFRRLHGKRCDSEEMKCLEFLGIS